MALVVFTKDTEKSRSLLFWGKAPALPIFIGFICLNLQENRLRILEDDHREKDLWLRFI